MAEFNPGIPDTPTRDWTSASRGPGVDQSLGTLFEGIGQAISAGVNVADTYIQNRIEDDARYSFEALNDETNLSVGTVPTEITRSADGLAKLAAAHTQGKITPEYYNARLASTLKGLRAKYPGYEKEVDAIMQKVTGVRPANAFRDSLLQSLDNLQRQQASSQSKQETFIQNNAKYLNQDEINNPQKYGTDYLVKKIQSRQAHEYGFEYEKKLIESNDRNATVVFSQKLSYESNEALSGVGSALGFRNGNITEGIKDVITRGGFTPEQKAEALAGIDGLIANQTARLYGFAADPAFASIPMSEKQAQITAAIRPLQDLREKLMADDYQAAAISLGRAQLQENRSVEAMYGEYPELAVAKALQKIDPASANLVTNNVITRAGGERKFTQSILGSDLGLITATGGKTLSDTVTAVIADPNMSQKEKNATIADMVENFTRNVSTANIAPEAFNTMIRQNYGLGSEADKLWTLVTPDQKLQLYQKMFSPEITRKVFEQGDDAAKAAYQNAAVDRLVNVPEFKTALDDLNGTIDYARFARINYDEGSNRISISVNQQGLENLGIFQRSTQQKWNADLAAFANRFNQALSVMAPIVEAAGGDEMENMSQLFKQLNLQVEGGNQRGFFYWANTVLDNAISNAANPGEGRSLVAEPDMEDFVPVQLPDGRTVELGDGPLEFAIPSRPQATPENLASVREGPSAAILDLIGSAEGTDRGASYKETLGYGAFTGGPVNLTDMTLNEVRTLQRQMLRHPQNRWNSSAVGRYQIVGTTLQQAMKELGLKGTEKFTPALQDRIALHLLEKRGLSRWKSGDMSDTAFLNSLAREWASLPTARGVGNYPGQNAAAAPGEVLSAASR